jgi:hypothetical protein
MATTSYTLTSSRTAVTTITITAADEGTTVANNKTLTAIRFTKPPSVYGDGRFELVDDGVAGYSTRLYAVDVQPSSFPTKQDYAHSWPSYELLTDGSVDFVNLTVLHVPGEFELDVT